MYLTNTVCVADSTFMTKKPIINLDSKTSALILTAMRYLTSVQETVTIDELDREINTHLGKLIPRRRIAKELAFRSTDHPDYQQGFADLFYRVEGGGVERWGLRKQ
jgi:hypothetical protein